MTKTMIYSLGVLALFAAAPVSAQTKNMMDCTESNLTTSMGTVEKMPAGEKRTVAMREMGMARDMMGKKDMAACKTHLNNAIAGDTIAHDAMGGKN
jgi:hypothetical protein